MLSASNIPVPDEYHHHKAGEQPTTVLILPAFTLVENVTPAHASALINHFVNPSITTTSPLDNDTFQSQPISNPESTENDTKAKDSTHPPPPSPPQASTSTTTTTENDDDDDTNIASLSLETPPTAIQSRACPHAAVILLCSQRTRDARCGQSAPLLRREFERHLRALGLYRDLNDERPGGVGIYFISHVGGHKYAANVMVYRRRDFDWYRKGRASQGGGSRNDGDNRLQGQQGQGQDENKNQRGQEDEGAAQGIWLARVRPEDCEGIIRFTVLQGKVVKPTTQLRGGFDRAKGLVSW